MSNKKNYLIIFSIVLVIILLTVAILLGIKNKKNDILINELPKPEITSGQRGEFGIDKNINESTIDNYLNRSDSVYRDMRMLEDPGNYEAIGGDRYLSGYINGFEIVPLPYIIPVKGLPSEVGNTYTGTTLFNNDNGTYKANYEESLSIIEELFPKDKVIFLMCGGGGYAGMMKNFLISMGWDENKIYNIGGYWYYNGNNNVLLKKEIDGKVTYDFDNVPYHNIDFTKLTKTKLYKDNEISVTQIKLNTEEIELKEKTSFQLNAIVLPNEASNKKVTWSSNDESVATVDQTGKVKALKEGVATITVTSKDGIRTAKCEVIVKKINAKDHIKLDKLTKEQKEFDSLFYSSIYDEYYNLTHDENGNEKEEYIERTPDGIGLSELGREELRKEMEKEEQGNKRRAQILENLLKNNKTFVVVYKTKECEDREYYIASNAYALLQKQNYSAFYTEDGPSGDETLDKANLGVEQVDRTEIMIFKDGKLFAKYNPNEDTISSDEELTEWLSRYIDIK